MSGKHLWEALLMWDDGTWSSALFTANREDQVSQFIDNGCHDSVGLLIARFRNVVDYKINNIDGQDVPEGTDVMVILEKVPEGLILIANGSPRLLQRKEGSMPKQKYDKKEWAWTDLYEEDSRGPFETREIAVEDAQNAADEEGWDSKEIILGHAVWPDPAKYIGVDVDALLDDMDSSAGDDGCWSNDDTLFSLTDATKADEELGKLLQGWAREWVEADHWTFEEVEKIVMSEKPEGGEDESEARKGVDQE